MNKLLLRCMSDAGASWFSVPTEDRGNQIIEYLGFPHFFVRIISSIIFIESSPEHLTSHVSHFTISSYFRLFCTEHLSKSRAS